ncbi:unnamed protein product [Protopolystoma xenopodis]|uniref:Uncharacterized protein n=1 Tax=Protopolystoma xenopodis TaxID=117903 RepID=A0A448XRJ3_9PLAT|nr:unnamed protein product [Protopolystoma xenopodis]
MKQHSSLSQQHILLHDFGDHKRLVRFGAKLGNSLFPQLHKGWERTGHLNCVKLLSTFSHFHESSTHKNLVGAMGQSCLPYSLAVIALLIDTMASGSTRRGFGSLNGRLEGLAKGVA